jgi:hypothetical protein
MRVNKSSQIVWGKEFNVDEENSFRYRFASFNVRLFPLDC